MTWKLRAPLAALALAVSATCLVAPAAHAASANAIDTTSRSSVEAAYRSRWAPATTTTVTSTAVPATCAPGVVDATTRTHVLSAWNFARGLAGLDAVTEDPALAPATQAAAVVFSRDDTLARFPGTGSACGTAPAQQAAAGSNVALASGAVPSAAYVVDGYLAERKHQAGDLGHRRWMLFPQLATTAVGVASSVGTNVALGTNSANVLRVLDTARNPAATSPAWVPWPTAGYFPAPLEPDGRWSLTSSSAGADFAAASVAVTGPDGRALPVTVTRPAAGYGNPTLGFQVGGLVAPTGTQELTYTVTVSGVRGAAAASHTYKVTLFAPAATAAPTNPAPAPVVPPKPQPAPPTSPVPPVPSGGPVERYVTRVYQHLFERAPDPSGLAGWTSALSTGAPRVSVANSITYSDEYRSRLIAGSYLTYLGRGPDPSGAAGWLGAMRTGSTIQQMEAGFIASNEYYAKAGGTDAGWVRRLYQHVLGRGAAPAEVQAWTAALARGGSRGEVASGFLLSTEHLTTVVDGYYVDLLGRHIDPSGARSWVAAIQAGARVEAIIGGIIASDEYFNRR